MWRIGLRNFARALPKKPKFHTAKEALEETKRVQPVPPPSKSLIKSEVTDEWMAKRHIGIVHMPEELQRGVQSVFSAYSSKEIREMGYNVAQKLTEIHGVEKPRDISTAQPFATSEQMLEKDVTSTYRRGFYVPKMREIAKLTSDSFTGKFEIPQPEKITEEFEYRDHHAIGYAYKRMPCTYAAIFRCLSEVKFRIPGLKVERVLDYGAGTGSGTWAAMSLYPNLKEVYAVEPNKHMRTVGKKITKNMSKVAWVESLANLPSISTENGLFDIVICGYVLGEVEDPATRALIVEAMFQRTKGVVLFIEPGTPKGFRQIHSTREWILSHLSREQASIVAPCPHEGNCPLAKSENSWCHFSQFAARFPKSIIGTVQGAKQEDNEKFSYILVKRGPGPRQIKTEEKARNPAERSYFWDRAIRPRIARKNHVLIDFCSHSLGALGRGTYGKLRRFNVTKKHGHDAYRYARKLNWGDLWPNSYARGSYFIK